MSETITIPETPEKKPQQEQTPAQQPDKWAFFSLTDKTDACSYAKRLVTKGYRILSAGRTCKLLASEGVEVMDLAELVGGGAILEHRVLSLSRELYAGLLADALSPSQMAELIMLHLPFVDFVYCNFYDMAQAIADAAEMVNRAEAIAYVVEKTDVGGPSMIHAGAKGLRAVVCRKQDIEAVLNELEVTGEISKETRQHLRARAEFEVAKYIGLSATFHSDEEFMSIHAERKRLFKGENGPQTPAFLFSFCGDDPLALDKFTLVEGSPPSYNNWCDVERGLQTISHLANSWVRNYGEIPKLAIGVKHGNASGAAVVVVNEHVQNMIRGSKRAIFGGVIMTNYIITEIDAMLLAQAMGGKAMFDGIIAPGFAPEAIAILARKKGKCRIMTNLALEGSGAMVLDSAPRLKYVRGGILLEPNYTYVLDFNDKELVVFGDRSAKAEKDLLLAWAVGCTSNSNTITIARNGMIIGNATGRQDRVGAAELAVKMAVDSGHSLNGPLQRKLYRFGLSKNAGLGKDAVAYSDSFFPFEDAVQVLIDAGVKYIFSTTGSVNDKAVQQLCLGQGVTLYQLPDSKARGFFAHGA